MIGMGVEMVLTTSEYTDLEVDRRPNHPPVSRPNHLPVEVEVCKRPLASHLSWLLLFISPFNLHIICCFEIMYYESDI